MSEPFGFLVIDKPKGLTSHDCVNRLRKAFGIKRVGHGGTLDPSVTGVLPIALGKATRLIPYLKGDKTYKGIIQLGKCTSTDDSEGEVLSENKLPLITIDFLENVLDKFRGKIEQKPPRVSSVHFKGERAYKRMRRGEIFDLPDKVVTINELLLLNWSQKSGQIEIKVSCSAGTYIRSLARDIGISIGCGGYLKELRRTEALGFKEAQAICLPEKGINNEYNKPKPINPLQALTHLEIKNLTESETLLWITGRKIILSEKEKQELTSPSLEEGIIVINLKKEIAGIAEFIYPDILKPKIVLNAKG